MLKNWKWMLVGFCLFLGPLWGGWAANRSTLLIGAVKKLGDGVIQTVWFSPDGSFIAVATSIGVRFLDATRLNPASFYRQNGLVHDITFLLNDLFAVGTSLGLEICSLSDTRLVIGVPNPIRAPPFRQSLSAQTGGGSP